MFSINNKNTKKVTYFGVVLPLIEKKWKWIAVDADGFIMLYTHKPRNDLDGKEWLPWKLKGEFRVYGQCKFKGDWQKSLRKI